MGGKTGLTHRRGTYADGEEVVGLNWITVASPEGRRPAAGYTLALREELLLELVRRGSVDRDTCERALGLLRRDKG